MGCQWHRSINHLSALGQGVSYPLQKTDFAEWRDTPTTATYCGGILCIGTIYNDALHAAWIKG